jgi:hypothetical protein
MRVAVRAEAPSGKIIEVGTTPDERLAYTWADRFHARTGCKTWIVDLDADAVLYTHQAAKAAAMGGAA